MVDLQAMLAMLMTVQGIDKLQGFAIRTQRASFFPIPHNLAQLEVESLGKVMVTWDISQVNLLVHSAARGK